MSGLFRPASISCIVASVGLLVCDALRLCDDLEAVSVQLSRCG
jgi:hypothetical protein